jgi:hypothetical protein
VRVKVTGTGRVGNASLEISSHDWSAYITKARGYDSTVAMASLSDDTLRKVRDPHPSVDSI